jgi:hypothetical protein
MLLVQKWEGMQQALLLFIIITIYFWGKPDQMVGAIQLCDKSVLSFQA